MPNIVEAQNRSRCVCRAKTKELDSILYGSKTMLIRGAVRTKMPYGKVFMSDVVYFIKNNDEGEIKAKATVASVFNSKRNR